MKLAVLVNRASELVPTMTTQMLIEAAQRRGHELWIVEIDALEIGADGIRALGRRELECAPERVALDDCDALMIRTNPARDADRAELHRAALDVARLLRDRGVLVVNDPDAIVRMASKLGLLRLPADVVPVTRMTADPAALARWAEELGPLVLKPAIGTRGAGVVRFAAGDDAAAALCGGPLLVQPYLPEAVEGDVRIVLVGGQPLEVDGAPGAIRRRPALGDFRSNLHAGGSPEPVVLNERMREIATRVGRQLADEGLWLVGLDLIGERVIELNVYATGGLYHARRFADGADFAGAIVDRLQALALRSAISR